MNTDIVERLPTKIASMDFTRLRQKLMDPAEGEGLSISDLDLAEREYRRFLALHSAFPTAPLVPNRLIDVFWHAHILDTQRYSDDCKNLFGYVLHHDPYMGIDGTESQKELSRMFAATKSLYEERFGAYPMEQLSAVRCKGHACHAPSPCACRSPGACTSHIGIQ